MSKYYYMYRSYKIIQKVNDGLHSLFFDKKSGCMLLTEKEHNFIRAKTVNMIASNLRKYATKWEDVDELYVKASIGEVISDLCKCDADFQKEIVATDSISDIEEQDEAKQEA